MNLPATTLGMGYFAPAKEHRCLWRYDGQLCQARFLSRSPNAKYCPRCKPLAVDQRKRESVARLKARRCND